MPLEVEGRVPEGLRGALVRVGPGSFAVGGQPLGHWFDGDGLLSRVDFTGEGATGAVRWVDTAGRRAEQARGRLLFGGYGTADPSWLPRGPFGVKNAANTALLPWNGELLALFEPGLPTRVRPRDLHTLGPTDLGGAVRASLSAHPKRLPGRRATIGFGVRIGPRCHLDLVLLPDGGRPRQLGSLPLPWPSLVHDCAATANHLVFFVPPLRFSPLAALLGWKSYRELLRWTPELGTEVIVVPVDDPEAAVRWRTEPFFSWHTANAWAEGTGLKVDLVSYEDFEIDTWLRDVARGGSDRSVAGRVERLHLDPAARQLRRETLATGPLEFPQVDPRERTRPHSAVYLAGIRGGSTAGAMLQDGLAAVIPGEAVPRWLDLGRAGHPSEPLVVPRPDGGRWLLAQLYVPEKDQSAVIVLDPDRPDDGPLCTAWLPHHLPPSFHGCWLPAAPPTG